MNKMTDSSGIPLDAYSIGMPPDANKPQIAPASSAIQAPVDTIASQAGQMTNYITPSSLPPGSNAQVIIAPTNNIFSGSNPGAQAQESLAAISAAIMGVMNKIRETKNEEQTESLQMNVAAAGAEYEAGEADIKKMQNDLKADIAQRMTSLVTDSVSVGVSAAGAIVATKKFSAMGSEEMPTMPKDSDQSFKAGSAAPTGAEEGTELEEIKTPKGPMAKPITEGENTVEIDGDGSTPPENTAKDSTADAKKKEAAQDAITNTDADDNNTKDDPRMAEYDRAAAQYERKQKLIGDQYDQYNKYMDVAQKATDLSKGAATNTIKIKQDSENIDAKTENMEKTFEKSIDDTNAQRYQAAINSSDASIQAMSEILSNIKDTRQNSIDSMQQQNTTILGG